RHLRRKRRALVVALRQVVLRLAHVPELAKGSNLHVALARYRPELSLAVLDLSGPRRPAIQRHEVDLSIGKRFAIQEDRATHRVCSILLVHTSSPAADSQGGGEEHCHDAISRQHRLTTSHAREKAEAGRPRGLPWTRLFRCTFLTSRRPAP